jgi:histone acetyltransferase (RNA polymerase elongator complex component)
MERDILDTVPDFSDTRRIFLADGDALAAPQQDLLALFALLNRHFPRLKRIGMYANARSILGKSLEELMSLREQGLGILYLGVESGDDTLLDWMQKGVTARELVEASRRVKHAGIKLSVTVLLGIGGSSGSLQHACATGKLLTEIGPDYVGALTTMVVRGTPLYRLQQSGEFELPDSFAILNELAVMIEHTEMRGLFFANHASNYLPVQVRMPMERDTAVKMIREFVRQGDARSLKPERLRRL